MNQSLLPEVGADLTAYLPLIFWLLPEEAEVVDLRTRVTMQVAAVVVAVFAMDHSLLHRAHTQSPLALGNQLGVLKVEVETPH
jgi:hypothetical protein